MVCQPMPPSPRFNSESCWHHKLGKGPDTRPQNRRSTCQGQDVSEALRLRSLDSFVRELISYSVGLEPCTQTPENPSLRSLMPFAHVGSISVISTVGARAVMGWIPVALLPPNFCRRSSGNPAMSCEESARSASTSIPRAPLTAWISKPTSCWAHIEYQALPKLKPNEYQIIQAMQCSMIAMKCNIVQHGINLI